MRRGHQRFLNSIAKLDSPGADFRQRSHEIGLVQWGIGLLWIESVGLPRIWQILWSSSSESACSSLHASSVAFSAEIPRVMGRHFSRRRNFRMILVAWNLPLRVSLALP